MTTNHRTPCPYCKTTILTRDYGKHLLSKHHATLFDAMTADGKSNITALWKEKYEKEPFPLYTNNGTDPLWVCLADNSAIKRYTLAEPKVKKQKDAHRQGLLTLRDTYPDPKGVQADTGSGLTPSQVDGIQQVVWTLLDRIRGYEEREGTKPWEYTRWCKRGLAVIPFSLAEAELKAKFEEPEDEPEPEPETKETQEEEWPALCEPPKPKGNPVLETVKEVMRDHLLTVSERQDFVRNSIAQHHLTDPELERFLVSEPKTETLLVGNKRRPKPVAASPPPPSEKKPLPPTFNPQSYISVPEHPKYPTIVSSTKRSTQ